MDVRKLIKTIYLGDRYCKEINFNGHEKKITLKINSISRIRDASGEWNFYTDEDINDGLIVFSDVVDVEFNIAGPIPNDTIDYLEVVKSDGELYTFTIWINPMRKTESDKEGVLEITAKNIHLEDPTKPGVKIMD